MKLTIKRIDNTLPLPAYHSDGAAAFDLYSRLDMVVQPDEVVRIPANLIIATPPGHALVITLRSSTPKKKGLSHPGGIGVIDPDYAGPTDEIMIQVHNVTDQPVSIARGERLAQALLVAAPRVSFEEAEEMTGLSRGGFGSTGL
ncbi:MAG: dUTP diphosphatase [Parcubacteria group bacterium]|nr:dUTP diphosphatase [Parcubacteria group bacterium]